jgi:hypothetical protein
MKLRREKGLEAANKALETISLEQMRSIIIDANRAIINAANLYTAEYADLAVDMNLDISQKPKQETDSLIKRIKELK